MSDDDFRDPFLTNDKDEDADAPEDLGDEIDDAVDIWDEEEGAI